MKIVIFNGPPSSGKDTICKHLMDYGCHVMHYGCINSNSYFVHEKFAKPLKDGNRAIFDLTDEEFDLYDNDPIAKNERCERFSGKSWRDVNIMLSENYFKPNFGKSIFGDLLSKRIQNKINMNKILRWTKEPTFIISDGGFREELESVVAKFNPKDVYVIKLFREGCSFAGDSRNYIDTSGLGVNVYEITNNDLNTFKEHVENLLYTIHRE